MKILAHYDFDHLFAYCITRFVKCDAQPRLPRIETSCRDRRTLPRLCTRLILDKMIFLLDLER